MLEGAVEATVVPQNALDILAQVVIAAAAMEERSSAELLRDRYSSLDAAALAKALVAAGLDPACEGRVLDAARLRRSI
jgi:hypothetical protein